MSESTSAASYLPAVVVSCTTHDEMPPGTVSRADLANITFDTMPHGSGDVVTQKYACEHLAPSGKYTWLLGTVAGTA